MTEDSAGTCVSSMHIEFNVTACKFILLTVIMWNVENISKG